MRSLGGCGQVGAGGDRIGAAARGDATAGAGVGDCEFISKSYSVIYIIFLRLESIRFKSYPFHFHLIAGLFLDSEVPFCALKAHVQKAQRPLPWQRPLWWSGLVAFQWLSGLWSLSHNRRRGCCGRAFRLRLANVDAALEVGTILNADAGGSHVAAQRSLGADIHTV